MFTEIYQESVRPSNKVKIKNPLCKFAPTSFQRNKILKSGHFFDPHFVVDIT